MISVHHEKHSDIDSPAPRHHHACLNAFQSIRGQFKADYADDESRVKDPPTSIGPD
jgi:hypothetical protein